MRDSYIRLINSVLPFINLVMLIISLVLAFKLSLQWIKKEKLEAQEVKNEQSVIIIVSRDGIFHVLDAKTVEILSLSPLMIRDLTSQVIYQKAGKFYIFYKKNIVLITDLKYEELKGNLIYSTRTEERR